MDDRAEATKKTIKQDRETDYPAAIRGIAGLVVVGFVGALNVIGLKSDELSAVMRNHPTGAPFIFALLVGSLIAAVASVFVSARAGSRAVRFRAQPLLICLAILLGATSAFAALQLEARSQRDVTGVELSPSITRSGGVINIKVQIQSSKLRSGDRVRLTAWGLPEGSDVRAFCATAEANSNYASYTTCPSAPCYWSQWVYPEISTSVYPMQCTPISQGNYHPTALGSIAQTILFSIPSSAFQQIDLVAEFCGSSGHGSCLLGAEDIAPTFFDLALSFQRSHPPN